MTRQLSLIYALVFAAGFTAGAVGFGATPKAAASFAADAYDRVEVNRPFVRWIWNESGTPDDYNALVIAINTALNTSETSYVPPRVDAEGIQLLLVDFTKLGSGEPQEINRLLHEWDKLAIQDKHFHVHDRLHNRIRPSVFLEDVGHRLETIAQGGVNKLTLPLAYGPWIHAKMLASVDGGAYLNFRGLIPGKTTLAEYLESREARIPKKGVERLALISHVTGKARGITYYQGQGVRSTAGRALVFITDDIFDENANPNSDPFHALKSSNPDGHEVFVVLPSGWIEFTLWNGQGVLVSEAPMGSPKFLVSDHRVPEPFAPRLHGAVSCLRCHAANDGYQPAQNEVADRLRAFGVLAGSLKGHAFTDLKKIGELYQAKQFEIDDVLHDARDGFSRRVFEVTGIQGPRPAKIGCDNVAALYSRYEYTWVDAKLALARAGVELAKDDPQGLKAMARLALPENPELYPPEILDIMLHLATESTITENGKQSRVPLKVTVRQWESAADTINRRLQEIQE